MLKIVETNWFNDMNEHVLQCSGFVQQNKKELKADISGHPDMEDKAFCFVFVFLGCVWLSIVLWKLGNKARVGQLYWQMYRVLLTK